MERYCLEDEEETRATERAKMKDPQVKIDVLYKEKSRCRPLFLNFLITVTFPSGTNVGKYTVGTWMDEWFENYAKIKARPSPHQTYRGYINNHIKSNIGKVPLEKLTSLELQKFCKKLLTSGRIDRVESKNQAKGLSPKTVRNICQIIASAMKLAKEQRLIAADPTEGCALPKLKRKEMKTLPIEQLASFLRDARNSRIFEMYYVELAARLRRGELLGPKWEGIDFEHGNLWMKQ